MEKISKSILHRLFLTKKNSRHSGSKDSDQIFVVNDGNVTAHGTHEELLMSCPLYKEMWDAHISVKDTVKEGE